MKNTFTILFYIKKTKADANGMANVYLRITVNGKRSEVSINRKVNITRWNTAAGKAKGTSKVAFELNKYIETINNKLYGIQQKLVSEEKLITAEIIKNIYTGKNKKQKLLLEIYENHNKQVQKLIGTDFAESTLKKYITTKKHLSEYVKKEYNSTDIDIKLVNNKFITGFEYFLKTEKYCSHNTAIKYISNFKKIVRIAYANDWITKDPFFNWKARLKVVDREFLSEEEIQSLLTKEFKIQRLEQVKDIFLFSCFTGLAYADVKKLCYNDIVIGIDGGKWIKTKRKKTNTHSNIPILPTTQLLMDKYSEHPIVLKSGKILPVFSNQKMNAYLKEIADIVGITKNLTFHLARHTFATTVTLTNGVPIESVSKMLGHKSLKTTQHYAKIIDQKVADDMAILKTKFSVTPSNNIKIAK